MPIPMALLAVLSAGDLPPPPVTHPVLQRWQAGVVRCTGGPERFATLRPPADALGWGAVAPGPVTLRFRIDPSGRPLGVTRTTSEYVPFAEDLVPSLVASRFAPGSERQGCTVTYSAVRVAFAETPVDALIAYTLDPVSGALPRAGWDRITSPGVTCADDPRPEPLLRAFPDFRGLPGTPGARDWTMVGYDLDAKGRPVRVRRVTGTGNAALDRASLDAVSRSRFSPGERRGCLYPYWRAAATLAAPEPPSQESLRPAGATCPDKLPYLRQPTLTFPEAYRKRAIEGWAVVAFDVAPWGATGNLRVLAAEPSADFGEWALNVLRSATKPVSNTGYVGCIDRVLFRMGPAARLLVDGQPAGGEVAPD